MYIFFSILKSIHFECDFYYAVNMINDHRIIKRARIESMCAYSFWYWKIVWKWIWANGSSCKIVFIDLHTHTLTHSTILMLQITCKLDAYSYTSCDRVAHAVYFLLLVLSLSPSCTHTQSSPILRCLCDTTTYAHNNCCLLSLIITIKLFYLHMCAFERHVIWYIVAHFVVVAVD